MTTRRWVRVCSTRELQPGRGVAALVDGQQVALFLLPGPGGTDASRLRAIDNHDPVSGANVLARGLIGSAGDVTYVASPMHKQRFDLASGRCLDGDHPPVRVWPVRVWGSTVEVLAVSGDDRGDHRPAPTPTHCPFCALQCGMRLQKAPAGGDGPVEVLADTTFPVNQGRMCVKGWSAAGMLAHPERLRAPLVRDAHGRLQEASWDDALDLVARRLRAAAETHGPDAVGVFGSGALTNEKAYLLGKFARVALGTASIDYNGRYCMSSAAAGQNRAFGVDRGLPFPLSDIAGTSTLVLWGANPADTMPPLMQYVEAMQAAGGTLIVVDPRRSATAAVADLHLQPVPGTDLALAVGMLECARRLGVVDHAYVEARTAGWNDVEATLGEWTPERVEETTGVAPGDLRRVVAALAAPTAMILTGRGPEQQAKGTDTVTALINLMLAMGKVGRPNSGYGCLTGQGNGQGGREHGQKADQLPGYRSISDDADRAAVAAVWGVEPSSLPGPGRSAVEMLESIGQPGGVRALLVAGSNVAVASPDARRLGANLADLDLLVVLDSFLDQTAASADVVLPVTQWAEEDGTMTNLEGRVLRRRAASDPPAGVRNDIDVLCALAARLGHPERFAFASAEEVFDELRAATRGARADYSGITYARLDAEAGIHWPCPDGDHPGQPRLFASGFAHPDGRARLLPVVYRRSAEPPDDDFPVYFTTGRYREHYNSGAQTRRLPRLAASRPEPRLQLHPALAERCGVADGDLAEVRSRRAAVRFAVQVTPDIRPDTVFAPFHWGGEQAANALTVAALDPVSRMPEFKVCAVRVAPVPPAATGAGQTAPDGGGRIL
ncbi:nitrite reductase small subunit NirD [Acidiferrimicrobium sp. IK]|uniref:nitrite reductase small subunit NirD n=1 Tax=Acidiferrimicrobium sp. IK TaxID=2871700 RepID=UPI0021CB52F8|nr:nitrite reductase small subunit NirD [Acidiferrimicrobium sp. IK]MCU4185271.1 nitrite reductase small subunit NirD [Acidiferrimicrobium sp. IK]